MEYTGKNIVYVCRGPFDVFDALVYIDHDSRDPTIAKDIEGRILYGVADLDLPTLVTRVKGFFGDGKGTAFNGKEDIRFHEECHKRIYDHVPDYEEVHRSLDEAYAIACAAVQFEMPDVIQTRYHLSKQLPDLFDRFSECKENASDYDNKELKRVLGGLGYPKPSWSALIHAVERNQLVWLVSEVLEVVDYGTVDTLGCGDKLVLRAARINCEEDIESAVAYLCDTLSRIGGYTVEPPPVIETRHDNLGTAETHKLTMDINDKTRVLCWGNVRTAQIIREELAEICEGTTFVRE